MRLSRPAPKRETINRTRKNRGTAWNSSVIRIRRSSTQPPLYPATTPTDRPITEAITVTPITTIIDVRAPCMTEASMSRPRLSVPMRWWRDGARSGSATVRNGSFAVTCPASAPATTTSVVRAIPTIPAGWRMNRRSAARHRCGCAGPSAGTPAEARPAGTSPPPASAVADAGIDTGVDEVGDEIGEDQAEGDEQDHAQQDRVIPGLGRGQDEAAE